MINNSYCISSDPDIIQRALDDNDQFIVMASDGVWDVLSNEDVAGLCVAAVREKVACDLSLHVIEAAMRR